MVCRSSYDGPIPYRSPLNQPEEQIEVRVAAEADANARLDTFLVKEFAQFSRAKLQRAIADGDVVVDGQSVKSSFRLKPGQKVAIKLPQPESLRAIPEAIDLEVLFQNEQILAINKPPGMVVHPAKGHWSGTLTAALAYHFDQLSQAAGANRPGIVHRLDRDTSGVILIAKTDQAHYRLSRQFEKRTVEKEYWALVSPPPDRDRDVIDKPIGAHPYQREKMAIRAGHKTSRAATTFFEVLERRGPYAHLRVLPKTGRTHQIRVHLAHAGSPVLCDRLYSGRARLSPADLSGRPGPTALDAGDPASPLLERQALHAYRIRFTDPQTEQLIEVVAPPPPDFKNTWTAIQDHFPAPG